MNKNGTNLTAKIEDLKQHALKSGNTFVVDMINSSKNPNYLFYENMNKIINKGRYHGESLTDKVKDDLIINDEKDYVKFNGYQSINKFFSHNPQTDNNNIQYYKTIQINNDYFIKYLFEKIKSLFNKEGKHEDCYKDSNSPDIKYINMLLDENNSEIKNKIYDIIVSKNKHELKLGIKLKLGDKLKTIVLNYKVFIELINKINNIRIKYETIGEKDKSNVFKFLFDLENIKLKQKLPIVISYSNKWDEINYAFAIRNALANKENYDKYLDYLLNIIMDGLLFKKFDDNATKKSTSNIFNDIVDNEKLNIDRIAVFILTTCLFIGKEYEDKEK